MSLEDIRRSYSQATRRWSGCDWPTRFGEAGLNLEGCTAHDAEMRAHQPNERSAEWQAAARWLEQIEQFAERAEVQAALALAAANAGDLPTALEHVDSACALEKAAGRANGAADPVWHDLRRAIAGSLASNRTGPHVRRPAARSESLANELRAVARTLEQLAGRVRELEGELETAQGGGT